MNSSYKVKNKKNKKKVSPSDLPANRIEKCMRKSRITLKIGEPPPPARSYLYKTSITFTIIFPDSD
jgi:hypothetical protein